MFNWVHRRSYEAVVNALNARLIEKDDQIQYLRDQFRDLQMRNDRLTMALAQKAGVELVIPLDEPPPSSPGPKTSGWFDRHVASPVPPVPPKGGK